jgi:hypothetical protein
MFEGLRRDRVERVVKQSWRIGERKAPTGWLGRKMRDLILPVFLRKGAKAAESIYEYKLDWEERISRIRVKATCRRGAAPS